MSGIVLMFFGGAGGGITVISDGAFSGAPLADLSFGG
jgi:hypothetical protein